jgi:ribosomal protein S27AE
VTAPGDTAWKYTNVQCVECGSVHVALHPVNADCFRLECPYCGSTESLPTGFEADLLDDPSLFEEDDPVEEALH